ncbi:NAD(P)-binding protein, partial [Neolentinus lepideus HHB14362 ss-1]
TSLRNRIISALRSSEDLAARSAASSISQNFIFTHNTIKGLASAMHSKVFGCKENEASGTESHISLMRHLVSKYSESMGPAKLVNQRPLPSKAIVLLTGTTGGLGSYMLYMLLVNEAVERVYGFNRKSKSTTLSDRQRAAFEDRGLPIEVLASEKLVLVEGEETCDKLGLDEARYEEIRTTCTHVIHNAWRLDFNLSVSSFEPNIHGTRNLIDLALASAHGSNMRFVFTSSAGVTQSWDRNKGAFPEDPSLPLDVAVGAGYGESKFVSEKVPAEMGIQTSSLRIGQVCGGHPDGAWATTDWVPIFVKSSRALGCLPDAQGVASWVPFEIVAKTILSVAFSQERPALSLNVVHPHPVKWSSVVRKIAVSLTKIVDVGKEPLPAVPIREWVALLEKRAAETDEKDIKAIPAIKLLDYFQHMATADDEILASGLTDVEAGGIAPSMSTDKAQAVSTSLRDADIIEDEDVDRWVRYWKRRGLFE